MKKIHQSSNLLESKICEFLQDFPLFSSSKSNIMGPKSDQKVVQKAFQQTSQNRGKGLKSGSSTARSTQTICKSTKTVWMLLSRLFGPFHWSSSLLFYFLVQPKCKVIDSPHVSSKLCQDGSLLPLSSTTYIFFLIIIL